MHIMNQSRNHSPTFEIASSSFCITVLPYVFNCIRSLASSSSSRYSVLLLWYSNVSSSYRVIIGRLQPTQRRKLSQLIPLVLVNIFNPLSHEKHTSIRLAAHSNSNLATNLQKQSRNLSSQPFDGRHLDLQDSSSSRWEYTRNEV